MLIESHRSANANYFNQVIDIHFTFQIQLTMHKTTHLALTLLPKKKKPAELRKFSFVAERNLMNDLMSMGLIVSGDCNRG